MDVQQVCFEVVILLSLIAFKTQGFKVLSYWALDGSDEGITYHGGPTITEGVKEPESRAIDFNYENPNCSAKIPKVDLRNIDFSIALWVKIKSKTGRNHILLSDWANLSSQRIFTFQLYSNLRVLFKRIDNALAFFKVETTKTLAENQWYHVAVSWHQSLGVGKLFIDGKEEASAPFATNRVWKAPSQTYQIGNDDHNIKNRQINGSIMALYIIEGALNSDQIVKLKDLQVTTIFRTDDIVYTGETIHCTAIGTPTPHVAWVRSEVVLVNKTSDVEITVAENNGEYECIASSPIQVRKVVVKAKAPLEVCLSNSSIDDTSRSVDNPYDSSSPKSDVTDVNPRKWYRFQGPVNSRPQLPTRCVPQNSCGAQAPGWLNGQHPGIKDGVVKREVCFHFKGDCCYRNTTVFIRNCHGFYLYKFGRLPLGLPGRYCMDFSHEMTDEDRADSIFQESQGVSMVGHVMYTIPEVKKKYMCMKYCQIYNGCKSFNFSSERMICELNSATQRHHSSSLKKNSTFNYYEQIELSIVNLS